MRASKTTEGEADEAANIRLVPHSLKLSGFPTEGAGKRLERGTNPGVKAAYGDQDFERHRHIR